MTRIRQRSAWMAAGLLVLSLPAVAQDAPSQDPKPPEEAAPAPAKVERRGPRIDVSYSNWGLRGNQNKFRQYGTPPDGGYVREISYGDRSANLAHEVAAFVKTPGELNYLAAGRGLFFYGKTEIAGDLFRNVFFETAPAVLNQSERKSSEVFAKQMLSRDVALHVRAWQQEQNQYFEPPLDAINTRTRVYNATLEGSVFGNGFFSFGYNDRQFYDRRNVQPDTNVRNWNVSYAHDLAPSLSVRGSIGRSEIKQPGLGNSHVNGWNLGAQWELLENTMLLADLRSERLDLPVVQNAYVRERSQFRTRLVHRWQNWNAQLAYRLNNFERVREDQTFVDAARWHGFEAQLNGRLSPWTAVRLRAWRDTLDGRATMGTEDPRALYWRNRTAAQARIEFTSDVALGYVSWEWQDRRNDARDTSIRHSGLTLGGSWLPKGDLELYGEATFDGWSARSGDPQAGDLDSFFPDGNSYSFGLNWAVAPGWTANANYTYFDSNNPNPLELREGNFNANWVTLGINYKLPIGFDIGINYAPWRYSDRIYPAMGYRTGLISITGGLRF